MKEDIKRFYIGCLTKDNEKAVIRQDDRIIELNEFFVADQTMLCDRHYFTLYCKHFEFAGRTTETDFDKVMEMFDGIYQCRYKRVRKI